MNIPDGIFFDMDTHGLSSSARLLLLDCFRRANLQYPTPVEDLKDPRAIRVVYREGRLGMTRPAFSKARKQLMRAGFLKTWKSDKTSKPNRDWYWLKSA